MLPPKLVHDELSLNESVTRNTVSLFVVIAPDAATAKRPPAYRVRPAARARAHAAHHLHSNKASRARDRMSRADYFSKEILPHHTHSHSPLSLGASPPHTPAAYTRHF